MPPVGILPVLRPPAMRSRRAPRAAGASGAELREGEGVMRRVSLGATGIETSCLGFGCAGARLASGRGRGPPGARRGLRRWGDLVRPRAGLRRRPGRGDRRPLPARRIATRCRSAPRPGWRSAGGAGGGCAAALMPLARRALARPVRCAGRCAGGATANVKLALTPELLTASLEASLAPARHRPGRTLRAARGAPRGGRPRRHPPGARGHHRRRQGAGGRGGGRRGGSGGGARRSAPPTR